MFAPFHLAFPVHDLDAARAFYRDVLGCTEGRSASEWTDFDFYGHQIVTHLVSRRVEPASFGHVDSKRVPVPHFGVVLSMSDWQELADKLQRACIEFLMKPQIRFSGQAAEQATMFFFDPSGNAIEIKAFTDLTQLFAK